MRILVVEDNIDILSNVLEYLELEGFSVDCAQDGLTGLHLAASHHYDLIVLDIMLPGLDGYQLCQRLRDDARRDTPILMLTARDALEDRLRGLAAGADDYLVKPFSLAELAARIRAITRRSQNAGVAELRVSDLVFNPVMHQVSRAGQSLKLNPMGIKLLVLLMKKSPAVVKREVLEMEMWGEDKPDRDSLRSHIHQLRQVVDRPFSQPLIHTVHGVGYRLAETGE
jgi:DNA-binding response OmpR family regulator